MAKINANENITVTVTISGKAKDVANVQNFMKENGVKYSTVQNNAKATGKAKASKANSNFDRKKYEEVAEKLGVLGKNGVYKFARPTVYKAMEEKSLTKKKIEEYAAEIMEIAKKKNLDWFTTEAETEVDLEDEEAI